MAEYRPRERLNAGKILNTHSTIVAILSRLSLGADGMEPRRRKMNVAKVPPNPIRKPLIINIRLQILGLLKIKEKQYEKEATAGPKRRKIAITAVITPFSVVVRFETSKAYMSATVIQHGI
mmetsp:Transcript_2593/g.7056  ORF Transcript_2593/g.7056 Transcript_2593/m.7056 type:complete len:121 (-) Transcript_2593:4173-4535(-)